jgi:hypothetical protein
MPEDFRNYYAAITFVELPKINFIAVKRELIVHVLERPSHL